MPAGDIGGWLVAASLFARDRLIRDEAREWLRLCLSFHRLRDLSCPSRSSSRRRSHHVIADHNCCILPLATAPPPIPIRLRYRNSERAWTYRDRQRALAGLGVEAGQTVTSNVADRDRDTHHLRVLFAVPMMGAVLQTPGTCALSLAASSSTLNHAGAGLVVGQSRFSACWRRLPIASRPLSKRFIPDDEPTSLEAPVAFAGA